MVAVALTRTEAGATTIYLPVLGDVMAQGVSPRLHALLVGEDPMLRYLVREKLLNDGVTTAAEAARPAEIPTPVREAVPSPNIVLCLSGPPEVWQKTIEETRRTLPGGRLVAVTFGSLGPAPGARGTDHRLGADSLVRAPFPDWALREALLRARFARPPSPTGPDDVTRTSPHVTPP